MLNVFHDPVIPLKGVYPKDIHQKRLTIIVITLFKTA